jgi:polygalacturonase
MIAAHVTVDDDQTMTVRHDDIQTAIDALAPASAGGRVEVVIQYQEMTEDEFAGIPELQ